MGRQWILLLRVSPQMQQQVGDVDPHWADFAAGSTKRRGKREFSGRSQTDKFRSDERADRTAVNPAVGMSADLAVNRTSVEAGAAADAIERFAHLFIRQRANAAVVH